MTENHFHTTPGIGRRVVFFPGDPPRSPVAGKPRAGLAASPSAQVLMAHTSMVEPTVSDLGSAGAHAARNALLEPGRGAGPGPLRRPRAHFIPALEQAAKVLVDARLTDTELSPATTAAHPHGSVRTPQRAFASLDESCSAYIHRRRLEEAATALTAPGSRPSVPEAAARRHFTDSGHSSALSRSSTERHRRNAYADQPVDSARLRLRPVHRRLRAGPAARAVLTAAARARRPAVS
ncbi:hypothetical protein ACFYO5_23390 [Streptomyces sp. NPDC006259]|uniref:hypothetical protein n=1 Tax=Streptomyces sp. NPDC006259 TaxID=3364740 RepID=UPI0036A306AB